MCTIEYNTTQIHCCLLHFLSYCSQVLFVYVCSIVAAGLSVVMVSPSSHIGHYISAQLDPTQLSSFELVIATYSVAAYICNYTFSYQVHGGAELVLRDSSGTVIWSSGTNDQDSQRWIHVTLQRENVQHLTNQLSDGLQFVLVRPTTSFSSETLRVFLDDVNVDFCLPCDFQQLQSSGMCSTL